MLEVSRRMDRWTCTRLIMHLLTIQSKESRGYIFSEYAHSLVGYDGSKIRMGASVLPFTIKVEEGLARVWGEYKGRVLNFTGTGHVSDEGFKIEKVRKGSIRIMDGKKCVGVKHGMLVKMKCVRESSRQKFKWLPISPQEKDAQYPKNKSSKRMVSELDEIHGTNDHGSQRVTENIYQPHRRHATQNLPEESAATTRKMIIEVPIPKEHHLGDIKIKRGKQSKKGEELGTTELLAELLKKNQQEEESTGNNSKVLDSLLNSNESDSDSNLNNIDEIRSSEDSNSGTCKCVRNPKNGKCYYALGMGGNMEPICSISRDYTGIDLFKEKLDKWLEELSAGE